MSEKKRASFSVLWLILTIVFAILTIVSIVGASILNIYSAAINAYFNVLPYKLVDVDPNETVDSEYYKSAFVTANGNYDDEGLYDYDLRVSQQIVNEGSVMLWNNDNALPLNKGAAVSCFSNTSVNMVYTGTGSGSISTAKVKTFKDGLLQYDFKVNETLWDFYESGAGSKKAGYGLLQKGSSGIGTGEALTVKEVPWNVISADSGVTSSFGSYGDAAIFVLGRSGGEGGDLGNNVSGIDTIGHDYLQLSEEEVSVLDNLINLKNGGTFKKVILIINSSNAMQMDMISDYADEIDACLWVGQPGAGGAPGIAKLLCGEATPSGHLVDTYCYDNDSSPAMVNFYVNRYSNRGSFTDPVTGGGLVNEQTAYTVYQEGIYANIKDKADLRAIGLYTDYDGSVDDDYTIMVCCAVDEEAGSRNDGEKGKYETRKIPAGRYARFKIVCDMRPSPTAVSEAWREIWETDLPRTYICDFEEYQNEDMEHAEVHIYIGLKEEEKSEI